MLRRVEYSVMVPVPPVLAFRSFCDFKRLLNRNLYAEAAWIEGAPWHPGSRARFVVLHPVAAVISAVVSSCDPPNSVSLIHHGLGITAEQQVTFRMEGKDATMVRIVLEAIGRSREISDAEVQRGIEFLTRDALDTLLPNCESFYQRLFRPEQLR